MYMNYLNKHICLLYLQNVGSEDDKKEHSLYWYTLYLILKSRRNSSKYLFE